jgi:L-lysine 2,3-aminomutase
MLPAFDDRDPEWPSHPLSTRDSLHEADMWAVEGLTHRYPTKVLAELLPTCPQYCGHCTRMDLVGNSTPQVAKYRFEVKQPTRHEQILDYLRRTPSVRDVVVSGGDVANLPIRVLEQFVSALLDRAKIMPYYFYVCDMIPNSEHWRTSIAEAQELQHAIMGYLPGFATPRVVADIPFVGKRWVHQVEAYDREKGISYWTKNYRTGIEFDDPDALSRRYEYYDPIRTLPETGKQYWRKFGVPDTVPVS